MHQALYKRAGRKGGNPIRIIVNPGIGAGSVPDGATSLPALRIAWEEAGKCHQLLVSDMYTLVSLSDAIRSAKRELDKHYARKMKTE